MKRLSVNIRQLSQASGVSRNQIGRIKAGQGTRVETLAKIANAFENFEVA